MTRAETAAATRRSLVRAASELLDEGGPDAVTLRAVGARAGVSRGAPYGHFPSKEHLLTQLAIDAWTALADEAERLRADQALAPTARLEQAVLTLIAVCRRQPYLYTLMFNPPVTTPTATEAAGRVEALFLSVVADVVGRPEAPRYAALLMSSAHGIATLEHTGHLSKETWQTTVDQLVHLLISLVHPT